MTGRTVTTAAKKDMSSGQSINMPPSQHLMAEISLNHLIDKDKIL